MNKGAICWKCEGYWLLVRKSLKFFTGCGLADKELHLYRPVLPIHQRVMVSFLERSFCVRGGATSLHRAVLPNFKLDFSHAVLRVFAD